MDVSDTNRAAPEVRRNGIWFLLALCLVLVVGAYFRFTGLFWGDYEYPHPDERFLVWVTADIAPVDNLGEYFDTARSTLNPANRGHAFYVYGDLPVIATRYLAESLFEQVGWQEILQTGRAFSATADLVTVLLVFLTAAYLFGWPVGLLAGLFSAAAVLQIQQSHFYTTDSFSTTFSMLAVYLAVRIASARERVLGLSLGFGAAVGLAMACKINTVVVAGLLPAALFLHWLRIDARERWSLQRLLPLVNAAALAGVLAFAVFRVAQPYAFAGPGIFDIHLDDGWMKAINDLRAQSTGDVDFPPALQWARRSKLFSIQNMVLWGLGVPLGALAWAGFLWMGYHLARCIFAKGLRGWAACLLDVHLPGSLILWGWTGVYFAWQSMAWNPTMRYQLPVYPTLAVLAAWLIGDLWNHPRRRLWRVRFARPRAWRAGVAVLGSLVLLLTLAWAFAFTRIYTRAETRVAASEWIFENVPGPVNLELETPSGPARQMLPVVERAVIRADQPYLTYFAPRQSGALGGVTLARVQAASNGSALALNARVYDSQALDSPLAEGTVDLQTDQNYEQLAISIPGLAKLEAGKMYLLSLEMAGPGGPAGQDLDLGAAVTLSGALQVNLYGSAQERTFTQSNILVDVTLPEGGTLREVHLPAGSGISMATILLHNPLTGEELFTQGYIQTANGMLAPAPENPDAPVVLTVDPPLALKSGVKYLVAVTSSTAGQPIESGQPVILRFLDEPVMLVMPSVTGLARAEDPLWTTFVAQETGTLRAVTLGHAVQLAPSAGPAALTLELVDPSDPSRPVAVAQLTTDLSPGSDPRGRPATFEINPPVDIQAGVGYTLRITPGAGQAVAVRGSATANESTWDMGLPFRMDGYDPYGGIYRNDLNFEMYWPDNADKLQRFLNILDQADYIFMSSNRQWGTTTRVPERHPLTTEFYRSLLGCPPEQEVIWCYNVAEPGTFQGRLGYDLVEVFTSYPNLGPVEINDQFAEEAFTVYDHAKVMVFRKNDSYNAAQVQSVLGAVDLDRVATYTPRRAAEYKDMLLPAATWAIQQANGTYASLFPPEGLLNRYPWLALVVYYLFVALLGVVIYPLLRMALPGLPDRGYPLGRIAGMVIFGYLAWISGSLGVQVSRTLLLVIFAALALVGLVLAYLQRSDLRAEWAERRGYFLRVELVALGFFLLSLAIRLGNPDLWHPIYGGEKPMNFSFFNAVLKSAVFPPYDPWFAGGSLNYYYYGYVLVGMPIKLLGINPSVAYNLLLPGLFSVVALAALSIGVNLVAGARRWTGSTTGAAPTPEPGGPTRPLLDYDPDLRPARLPVWAGLVAAAALLIIGNLGTARMFWQGWQKIVVPDEQRVQGSFFDQAGWAAQGFARWVQGNPRDLPYYPGDWYWKPSRAIQPESGSEITEFPFFTFLYADLHAHLMALPVTLLVIAWSLGVVLGRGCWGIRRRWRGLSLGLALLLGALGAGALRPANTWDQYTYLIFASIALFYSQWRYEWDHNRGLRSVIRPALLVLALAGLALLFYRPFDQYFAQAYNALDPWKGPKTNLTSYLTHWGLFLFVIAAWLFDEAVDWMSRTPLAALAKLRRFMPVFLTALVAVALAIVLLLTQGVVIALVAVPLGVVALALLFRPDQTDAKRLALFMTGTALVITLAVELVAVRGDNGRMNTVFKFYYQAWSLFSLSAAAALWWLMGKLRGWNKAARRVWIGALSVLVMVAILFPITSTRAKVTDRMNNSAPRTLDGMTYMKSTYYYDGLTPETYREMDLNQDYEAIRWMQANVPGSPVIVEANAPEYRHWGTRYTIYTGLPGVVGWNYHERQQRALTPDTWVWNRIYGVADFYNTTSRDQAAEFLHRYNVQYIIVGQLERILYDGQGLAKFASLNGDLWERVYQDRETDIYRVK